jgi:hypothetical protein
MMAKAVESTAGASQETKVVDEEDFASELTAASSAEGRHLHQLVLDENSGAFAQLRADALFSKPLVFDTTDRRIFGQEAKLLAWKDTKVTVYFVTDEQLRLESQPPLHATVKFLPASSSRGNVKDVGQWELSLDQPGSRSPTVGHDPAWETNLQHFKSDCAKLHAVLNRVVLVIDHPKSAKPTTAMSLVE